jgi:methyl-accepting chemotaxis protein
MSTSLKRSILGRGKGYLNFAGPQSRFIIFLIFVLMAYTLLLRVFQKLAEMLQLPLFFSISLITLLVFIGVVGTVYSHSFVGPMLRIRRTIDQLAQGDTSVCIRLRESDDPMLKELVDSICRLAQHHRNSHAAIAASAQDLTEAIGSLQQAVQAGADKAELQKHLDGVRGKRDVLEKMVKSLGGS